MAGKYSFTVKQGATFGFGITWKDSNGDLVDLTGYTARMQLRYGSVNGDVAIELTTENGGLSIDELTSSVVVSISAEQSEAILARQCVYDLEMVKDDRVVRLIEGKVKISPEVTR